MSHSEETTHRTRSHCIPSQGPVARPSLPTPSPALRGSPSTAAARPHRAPQGSVWNRLGSKVTVVELTPRCLPEMDADLGSAFGSVTPNN